MRHWYDFSVTSVFYSTLSIMAIAAWLVVVSEITAVITKVGYEKGDRR